MYRLLLFLMLCFLINTPTIAGQKLLFVAENLPPYHYYDDNRKPIGVLVDIVAALKRETQLDIEIELMPQARANKMTKHKKNVFLFSLLKTPSRQTQFQWIGQVYQIEALLVGLVNKPQLEIKSLEEAKKHVIGTVRGYYAEQFLRQNGFSTKSSLFTAVDYQQLWQLLMRGRIDYVLTNSMTLETELRSINISMDAVHAYQSIDSFPNKLYIATGVKTEKQVVQRLAQGLARLKASGEYGRIIARW